MNNKQTQKSALFRAGKISPEKSGKTSPGPILFGAVALARIVPIEPMTWAARRANAMWKRVTVLRRIIPKPRHAYC